MEVKEKFEFKSEALRKARENKGYKQDELAKQVFTTRQSISNWENGKKIPTLENVDRLAKILDVSIDDLIVRKVEEKLNTNDEELLNYDTHNYDLVCKSDIKKRKKYFRNSKFIKIFLALILIVLIIYLESSIRKFIILTDIKNKMVKYENLDNYSYIKTYYEINNMQCTAYYTENIFYKDGISKAQYYDGKKVNIVYMDNKEVKLINEETKECEILEAYQENIFSNNLLANMHPELISKNNFINCISSFNPSFHIKEIEEYYIIEFNSKRNKDMLIIENISTDGLLKEKSIYYSNENYERTIYEIKINEVTEKDLEINCDGYNIIK